MVTDHKRRLVLVLGSLVAGASGAVMGVLFMPDYAQSRMTDGPRTEFGGAPSAAPAVVQTAHN
jgi:hypothetical protein